MKQPYEIAVYYFPHYHADPRNDAWHGKGWTEWELLKAARPRFPGHRQPVVPAWGYFDESDPAWAAREIDLAADHGISAFLYDWYWYEDGPFLNHALDCGFLQAPNTRRLSFALMWANHHWLDIHPATFRNQPEILCSGQLSRRAFEHMVTTVIERYFSQPNYLTIDGAPYFSLYELGSFIEGMGGLDEARRALAWFRERVIAQGFPDLHLNAIIWGVQVLPVEVALADPARVLEELGFSSLTSYVWVHHYDLAQEPFPHGSYAAAAEHNYRVWDTCAQQFQLPYSPNVSMGWDPSPRTVQSDIYENRGYPWHPVLEGNTPEAFGEALRQAKQFLDRSAQPHKMLTINAWNEWTEGSYLLPDTQTGTAYLQAVRTVFRQESGSPAPVVEGETAK